MSDIKSEMDKLLAAASAPGAPVKATPEGLVKVGSAAEFAKRIAEAKGQVAVLFTQTDCGYCDEDKKALEEMAKACPGSLTALEVSTDSDELNKLAEKWAVDGTPTLLFAERSNQMTPADAEEVVPDQLKRKLKCALPKKGK